MNEIKETAEWHLNEADKCLKQSMSFGIEHEYRSFLAEMAAVEHIRKARMIDKKARMSYE